MTDVDAKTGETRHYFDIVGERLEDQIKVVAEGYGALRADVSELKVGQQRLEAGQARLEVRMGALDRGQTDPARVASGAARGPLGATSVVTTRDGFGDEEAASVAYSCVRARVRADRRRPWSDGCWFSVRHSGESRNPVLDPGVRRGDEKLFQSARSGQLEMSRGRARTARPAAAWGSRGPRGASRVGFGAKPRLGFEDSALRVARSRLVPWKRINWKTNPHCDLKGHGKHWTPDNSVGGD